MIFEYPVGPRGQEDVFSTYKIDTILCDQAYFDARGTWHTGEDWNGKGGGDSDLGNPVYSISDGILLGYGHFPVWGKIVLIEHTFEEAKVWSQYAHLNEILLTEGSVSRGQTIGTIGKGDQDRYVAHLHFEIRKKELPIDNWEPMVFDKAQVLEYYYSPSQFIFEHSRHSPCQY